MKKLLFVIILLIGLLTLAPANAHGGVSKNVGSTIVYLTQTPVSPLVGERVNLNFVIRDSSNQAVANLPINLKLIDTYYGDESKDKEVLHKDMTTDINGSLNFAYTFYKENYFDVELNFLDPATHTAQNTGFLVQPRAALNYYWIVTTAILSLLTGYFIAKLNSKNKILT